MLESLFNKIVGLKVCKHIKMALQHRYCPVTIAISFKNSFFIERLWWLLPLIYRGVSRALPNIQESIMLNIFPKRTHLTCLTGFWKWSIIIFHIIFDILYHFFNLLLFNSWRSINNSRWFFCFYILHITEKVLLLNVKWEKILEKLFIKKIRLFLLTLSLALTYRH